ncbi:MAG: hypothetical protein WAL59_19160 [Roseiarcus sp.]
MSRGIRPSLAGIREKATLPNSFELPTAAGENLLYLEQRGISGELAKHFHLRMCEQGWWNFTKQDGSKGGQRFDMRVIIPVYDLDGSFVTFQGRDITGASDRKYLFPSGLPSAGKYLFNAQNAVKQKRLVICEGVFDVFGAKLALDEEVALRGVVCCASFGMHLSFGSIDGNDQLGRLLRLKGYGLEEVTIYFDAERNALLSALNAVNFYSRS